MPFFSGSGGGRSSALLPTTSKPKAHHRLRSKFSLSAPASSRCRGGLHSATSPYSRRDLRRRPCSPRRRRRFPRQRWPRSRQGPPRGRGPEAASRPQLHPLGVSLESPEVSFVPSPLDGQFCERVLISGVPRLHLDSFASQIRVKMNASQSIPEKFHWKIEVCFHRNASMGLCQCEATEWKGFQDGIWTAVNSPYGNKYVDVKLADKKSARFTLSIQEEFSGVWLAFVLDLYCYSSHQLLANGLPFTIAALWLLGSCLLFLLYFFRADVLRWTGHLPSSSSSVFSLKLPLMCS